MSNETWRDRLAAAIANSGQSMRKISIAAGHGPGYVHSILKEGKDPTVDHLIGVCKSAGVTLSWVLYGFDVTPDVEQIMVELSAASPEERNAMLTLLRKKSGGSDAERAEAPLHSTL